MPETGRVVPTVGESLADCGGEWGRTMQAPAFATAPAVSTRRACYSFSGSPLSAAHTAAVNTMSVEEFSAVSTES